MHNILGGLPAVRFVFTFRTYKRRIFRFSEERLSGVGVRCAMTEVTEPSKRVGTLATTRVGKGDRGESECVVKEKTVSRRAARVN